MCGLSDPDFEFIQVPRIMLVPSPGSIGAHVIVEGAEVLMKTSLYVRLKVHHLSADKDLICVCYGRDIVFCRGWVEGCY